MTPATLQQRQERAWYWPLVMWHTYRELRSEGLSRRLALKRAKVWTHLWVWRLSPAPPRLWLWAASRFGDLVDGTRPSTQMLGDRDDDGGMIESPRHSGP